MKNNFRKWGIQTLLKFVRRNPEVFQDIVYFGRNDKNVNNNCVNLHIMEILRKHKNDIYELI